MPQFLDAIESALLLFTRTGDVRVIGSGFVDAFGKKLIVVTIGEELPLARKYQQQIDDIERGSEESPPLAPDQRSDDPHQSIPDTVSASVHQHFN